MQNTKLLEKKRNQFLERYASLVSEKDFSEKAVMGWAYVRLCETGGHDIEIPSSDTGSRNPVLINLKAL